MNYKLLAKEYLVRFKKEPRIFRSPGRINIIGEHTDYNEGFVFPAGVNKEIAFAISESNDQQCRLYSVDMNEEFSFDLKSFRKSELGWPNYIIGVAKQLLDKGYEIRPFNCVFGGDIPSGSGMSSSAALECGICFGLDQIFKLNINKLERALLAQKAEIEYVGVNCGLMDQFASVFSERDKAIFLDCRDNAYQLIELALKDTELILVNTMVKHSLASSEYNDRRKDCESVVSKISNFHSNIKALRDVNLELIDGMKGQLGEREFRHARFVIEENERVLEAVNYLKTNNMNSLGDVMYQSHDGLSKEYEVSCPELDFLVDETREMDFVLGSRMMGGGFGGCTINLVKREKADRFESEIRLAYREQYNVDAEIYFVETASGSSEVIL